MKSQGVQERGSSTFLLTRKMQCKTIIDITIHKQRSLVIISIGEDGKQPEPYTLLVRMQNSTHFGKQFGKFLKNLKHILNLQPSNFFPRQLPKINENICPKTYGMFRTALFTKAKKKNKKFLKIQRYPTKGYIVFDSTSMKFQKRQNSSRKQISGFLNQWGLTTNVWYERIFWGRRKCAETCLWWQVHESRHLQKLMELYT